MSVNTQETSRNAEYERVAHLAGKYLSFILGDETYAVEVLKVQEIIGILPVTRVPHAPHYIRGVINLRGKVVPVTELRTRFDLPSREDTPRTCIVVVQVPKDDRTITMGMVVDEVVEVLDVDAVNIEPCPEFGSSVDLRLINGVAKVEGKVVILLHIDRVLGGDTVDAAWAGE